MRCDPLHEPEDAARRRVLLAAIGAALTSVAIPWRSSRAAGDSSAPAPSTGDGVARASNLATSNLVLAGVRAGGRLIVVGEYGHVLLSDDEGDKWRQAQWVPTRTTLAAVSFIDERTGWAVGHGGVVLGTHDGGEIWSVLAGRPDGKDALFSVWFRDEKNGLVIGPFGFAARSADGGTTWTSFEIAKGELGERHLNQIVARGKLVLIAAESGVAFRSTDAGATFEALTLPYKGSIWGGTALADGSLLLWGMRGTVLRSADEGRSWVIVPTGTDRSLAGGAQSADGSIAIAGLNGVTLISRDGGASFAVSIREDRGNAAAVLATKRGFLLLGPSGIRAM